MPAPRHVLVLETHLEGHHSKWVALVTDAFQKMGTRVTVATSDPAAMRKRVSLRLAESALPEFIPFAADGARAELFAAAQLLKKLNADELFVPSLDNFASTLLRWAAFGQRPPPDLHGLLSGVYFRPRMLDPTQGGFNNTLKLAGFRSLARNGWWGRLGFVDTVVLDETHKKFPDLRCGLVFDPSDVRPPPSRAAARQQLGIPPGRLVLLHYGMDAPRKGLALTLEALRRCPSADRFFLLRAGPVKSPSPSLQEVHQLQTQGRALSRDHLILSEEESLLYGAADVVLLPYLAHYGSSSVLSDAAAAGRPVLASDYHWLGHNTRERRLGWIFHDQDATDYARKLDTIAKAQPADFSEFDAPLAEFARMRTPAAFAASLQELYNVR